MNVAELLAQGTTLSFEFFPARTPKAEQTLKQTLAQLGELMPSFVSVTTGAGGTSHEPTRHQVLDLKENYSVEIMAHITCSQNSRHQINRLLKDYGRNAITSVLALAGDPPQEVSAPGRSSGGASPGWVARNFPIPPEQQLTYAIELVAQITEHEYDFSIGVAAHPEVHPHSPNRESDRRHLAEKLSAADFAITQFFFDATHYFKMVEELSALGCDKPVIAGIMPVTSPDKVKHFAELNGTQIDVKLWERLERADEGDRLKIAVEAAHELCRQLLDFGAPGLHIYTMNRAEASLGLGRALGF